MDAGERITGTHDEHYNLVAVLYHALHGAENCEVYSTNAEAVGRNDQAAFFREARDIQRDLADRAKGLLGIGGGAPRAGGVTVSGATETGTQMPSQTGVPPAELGVTTEELPPPLTSASDAEPSSSGPARAGGGAPGEDVPPRTAQSGETPPPGPRRAALADTESLGEEFVSAEWEVVPPDAPRTEEPPPRTGDAPPSPSEQPPR